MAGTILVQTEGVVYLLPGSGVGLFQLLGYHRITQAETAGVPELEDLRTAIVEEVLAVAAAKGVTLEYPDPLPNISG